MPTWVYANCPVVSVHDGDTLTVDVDLGHGLWFLKRPLRLFGCAARELKDPGGWEAREVLAELCPPGTPLRVESRKLDKYGRMLGTVALPDGRQLASVLIADGWAVPWDGNGPQPKPPWPRQVA